MLLEQCPQVKFIIDLTKSTRYYDFSRESNVNRVQVPLGGHEGPPSQDEVQLILKLCDRFWAQNPDAYIGVHCTHGFNRTGFVICSYLVERVGQSVELAIAAYAAARPPGIYKQDYLDELCRRYDGDAASCRIESQPDWSLEDHVFVEQLVEFLESAEGKVLENFLEKYRSLLLRSACHPGACSVLVAKGLLSGSKDEGPSPVALPDLLRITESVTAGALAVQLRVALSGREAPAPASSAPDHQGHSTLKRKREIDEAREDASAEPSGLSCALPGCTALRAPHLGEMRTLCREMVGAPVGYGGFPGMQSVSLDKTNLSLFRQHKYLVSWKADGTRYLLLILGSRGSFLVGRDNSIFTVPNLYFPTPDSAAVTLDNTLLDGELVLDNFEERGQKKSRFRFLLFDMIVCQGERMHEWLYSKRLARIDSDVLLPREKQQRTHDFTREPMGIRKKAFCPLADIDSITRLRKTLCHDNDGYIFAPDFQPYFAGPCETLLKWKPPHLNSVDFQFQVVPRGPISAVANLLVVRGSELVRFDGAPRSDIQVSNDKESADRLRELNGKICECTWFAERNCWKFLKQRHDKTHPNAYGTAMKVFRSITDGISEEVLLAEIRRLAPAEKDKGKKP